MPFRRVVIGVDFTEASLAAARWVAMHLAPRAEIVLVHALPDPTAPPYLQRHLPLCSVVAASLAPALHGALRGLASVIGAERTRVYMTTGWPADALAHVAREVEADLVCVGRGARRRGSARFGATTAQRLLARTRVPTIVVPVGRHDTPTRIVAGVDDRPGGEQVLAVACRLAAAYEAGVDALHVIADEMRPPARVTDAAGDDAAALDRLRAAAHAWLARTLDRASVATVRTTPIIRVGDAGDELVSQLEASTADLVVVGRGGDRTHALLPAGVFPVGSTTRLVAWASACPVLVLTLEAPRGPAPVRAARASRRVPRPTTSAARDGAARAAATSKRPPQLDPRDGERTAS
jgi:nucleotide-binding universal stress UspA family protein